MTLDLPNRPERRLERAPDGAVGEPSPAATLVVLRPRHGGHDVLLTRRATGLRFGADLWVFPGGRVDPADADHRAAAARETAEETGLEIEPGDLIPMTRWVTPPSLPIRFDARFFAAVVDADAEVRFASPEVAAVAWLTPDAALAAHARGELPMWLPTFVTLQQLAGLASAEAVAAAFAAGRQVRPAVVRETAERWRVEGSWAGGIEGRASTGWLVGRREWVVVDPGDPTGETSDAIRQAAAEAGATLAGVVIRDLRPERQAGVEMLATGLGLPVAGGVGAAAAPYPVTELDAGMRVPFGDVSLVARAPSPAVGRERSWPGAVAFETPDGMLVE